AVAVGPVAGVRIPWRRSLPSGSSSFSLRVLTCNCGGSLLRAEDLRNLIAEVEPDVVALQEHRFTKESEARWKAEGWETRSGERICFLSRLPIITYERLGRSDLDGEAVVARHEILTPIGGVQIFSLQLTSPRTGLEAVRYGWWHGGQTLQGNIERREAVAELASHWILQYEGPVLVAGDFNMPVEGAIYRQNFSGYTNAFNDAGLGIGNTRFIPHLGFRVDHVLAGAGWRCRSCWVGPDVGSDHRPLVADWDWVDADE
ncbi:endonuclease/exonuclease/phosphatase family protein, partial [Singulisphaera rosea]